MLIDTHAHLNFNAYKEDSEEILKKALDAGMGLIMPGSQVDTSRRAVELAEKWNNPYVWAAVGLHPIHLEKARVDESEVGRGLDSSVASEVRRFDFPIFETKGEEFNRQEYKKLAESKKVIAIGEIGLDYWYRPRTKEEGVEYAQKQIDTLNAQLDMALELNLPVILHCRVAHKDLLRILREHSIAEKVNPPGVIHSYTGSTKQLKKFLGLGFYIGVNGLIYKLDFVEDAVREAPLDRILLETDSPYLIPPQVEGQTVISEGEKGLDSDFIRNEPINLKYIAEKIAEIKNISFEEVAKQTTENAQKVFQVNFE